MELAHFKAEYELIRKTHRIAGTDVVLFSVTVEQVEALDASCARCTVPGSL